MSDVTIEQVQGEGEVSADNGTDESEVGLDQMWALLNVMVPDGQNEIVDCFGEVHVVPTVLPARRQIRVLQEMKKLWDYGIDEEKGAAIFADVSLSGDIAGMVGGLVEVASDENLLGYLDNAFVAAFPTLVTAVSTEDATRPTDLFPIEEIVGGLLPFFVRMMKKAMSAMSSIQ